MPEWTVWSVHPGSLAMVGLYVYGLKLVREIGRHPLWIPERTPQTREDVPDLRSTTRTGPSTPSLVLRFVAYGAMVAAAGWGVAETAGALVDRTRLTETFVGSAMMGVANALPETITAVAAVRRGALTMAVAAVIGGNCFDALNLVVGDIAYRGGSLFHAANRDQLSVCLGGLLMTLIFLLGMLRRQRRGPANIGFESLGVLVLYACIIALSATR
jgi:cation:H+ antiporter